VFGSDLQVRFFPPLSFDRWFVLTFFFGGITTVNAHAVIYTASTLRNLGAVNINGRGGRRRMIMMLMSRVRFLLINPTLFPPFPFLPHLLPTSWIGYPPRPRCLVSSRSGTSIYPFGKYFHRSSSGIPSRFTTYHFFNDLFSSSLSFFTFFLLFFFSFHLCLSLSRFFLLHFSHLVT
jgi:hypothetical protein